MAAVHPRKLLRQYGVCFQLRGRWACCLLRLRRGAARKASEHSNERGCENKVAPHLFSPPRSSSHLLRLVAVPPILHGTRRVATPLYPNAHLGIRYEPTLSGAGRFEPEFPSFRPTDNIYLTAAERNCQGALQRRCCRPRTGRFCVSLKGILQQASEMVYFSLYRALRNLAIARRGLPQGPRRGLLPAGAARN